ncbi:MAG: DNA translocase FtsK, partial [Zetaproteobacteria bacterium]|nr:DNA translocase FtsK [Flavobacteriales bacterium]
MAKQIKSNPESSKTSGGQGIKAFFKSRQTHVIFGSFLIIVAIFLGLAIISYFSNWKYDQSTLDEFGNKSVEAQNLLGKIGAIVAHFFVYKGFGISSSYLPILL